MNLGSIPNEEVKIFILCNPHNPGGSVWTEEELSQLGNLCLKHEVYTYESNPRNISYWKNLGITGLFVDFSNIKEFK